MDRPNIHHYRQRCSGLTFRRRGRRTVVVALGVDPITLDPMNHSELAATVLGNNLFDGLI